jgi:esterase
MIQLNYKEYGEGEPILILHGLFGTLDNWQTIAKKLSAHYTVFILDLRNHGKSPHTEGVYDYPTLAEDIATFMQNRWIYNANIIGHSMGGKVSMQLALNYPDLVKKLVVVDIAPKKYSGGHETVFRALNNLDLTTLQDRSEAETYLMTALEHDAGTVQFLMKNLSRQTDDEGGGFEWKMNLTVLNRDYHILMDTVTGEPFEKDTLFIRGGVSQYIKDSDFPAIQKYFPKAQVVTIEGAGHWVHADKPKELFDVIMSFLM